MRIVLIPTNTIDGGIFRSVTELSSVALDITISLGPFLKGKGLLKLAGTSA